MRLLDVDDRSGFADVALEPIDVANEEHGLVGTVVVVVPKLGARILMGELTFLVLSVSGLGVGALGENGRRICTPATSREFEEDRARSRYGESFVGATSAAPFTGLMLYLKGDCVGVSFFLLALFCRDANGEADFGGLPRPRFGVLLLSLDELDRGALAEAISSDIFRFFVAPEILCASVCDLADCCEFLRVAALDGATTISSPMLSGSGRRSLGIRNLEKKEVIF